MAEFGEARRELRDRDWIGMGRGDSSRGLGCLRPDRGVRVRSGQGLGFRGGLTDSYWDLRIGF